MSNVTKVEVRKAEDKGELEPGEQWYWVALAANGEPVATGEMHPTLSNAWRSALAVFPEAEISTEEGDG